MIDCLASDEIYNKDTKKFTILYRGLSKKRLPTGDSYWRRFAGQGKLKNRKPIGLRKHFCKLFKGQIPT